MKKKVIKVIEVKTLPLSANIALYLAGQKEAKIDKELTEKTLKNIKDFQEKPPLGG